MAAQETTARDGGGQDGGGQDGGAQKRIALVGGGIIGRMHVAAMANAPELALSALIDPMRSAADLAGQYGVPWYPDLETALAAARPDGVLVASPNETHLPLARLCLKAGIPVLLEKPPANSIDEARELVALQAETGVPVLVGHHRRYNPMIRTAKAAIDEGRIGELVLATVICSLYKDEPYYTVAWRTRTGSGGPLHINLVHEIDLLRHFFGEIESVTAQVSNRRRGFQVEDTAAATVRFAAGGLGALTISDAARGPWSWENTSAETKRFPAHAAQAHFFSGSRAGLSLPDLRLWTHPPDGSWYDPQSSESLPFTPADPYTAQLRHFAAVIDGAEPMIGALDGARTMATLEAIILAAETGQETRVPEIGAA